MELQIAGEDNRRQSRDSVQCQGEKYGRSLQLKPPLRISQWLPRPLRRRSQVSIGLPASSLIRPVMEARFMSQK